MTDVLTRTGTFRHRDTRKEKRVVTDSRDQSNTSTNPKTPRITDNHQKLRERHGTDSPSETPKETNLMDTSVLDFEIFAV